MKKNQPVKDVSKRVHPKVKSSLHPRNKHNERYNFKLLLGKSPELARFVILNDFEDESIDFFNPDAVKALNKALLKQYYGINDWSIPKNYLCPPIPGRADYIHHIADLLYAASSKESIRIPKYADKITCLDIGVGANCIYPILGNREYGWSFIGSDIDPIALKNANEIIKSNPVLHGKIELRLQKNEKNIFQGIIKRNEFIDLTIFNPPFHTSATEADNASLKKLNNLTQKKYTKPNLNFGGQSNELWYEGGEEKFVQKMIEESRDFTLSVFWFSTLISKQANLDKAYVSLRMAGAREVKTIQMEQGNKISRILAWTFLDSDAQRAWIESRWS